MWSQPGNQARLTWVASCACDGFVPASSVLEIPYTLKQAAQYAAAIPVQDVRSALRSGNYVGIVLDSGTKLKWTFWATACGVGCWYVG